MKYLVAVLVIAIGITGMVYGEADDAPGLQLLGFLLVIGALAFGARTAHRQLRS